MEKTNKQIHFKKAVAWVVACMMLVGGGTAAYAADVGGIQRTVQLWLHGEQTEATLQFDGNGGYTAQYTGSDGTVHTQGGGGVTYAADGTVTPATKEELMAELNAPEVYYNEDGTVEVCWFGQVLDITDRFENDVCYVKLVHGAETLYMTVKYQNGYALSPHKYVGPAAFNVSE